MNSAAMPRLSHGLAANWLSPAAPNPIARTAPTAVNVITIPAPYTSAWATACRRVVVPRLVKYETVMGTIGNTHGVSNESAPMSAARPRYAPRVLAVVAAAMSSTVVVTAARAAAADGVNVASAPVPGTNITRRSRSVVGGRQNRSVHV